MRKNIHSAYLLSTMFIIGVGCQDYNPIAEGVVQPPQFDFATYHNVNIDIDYGEFAAYAPVSIYDEDPLRTATAENQSPVGEPINSLVLGSNGSYSSVIRIPISAKHLYLYSPSMGAPMLVETDVAGGRVSVRRASTGYNRALTRAEGEVDGPYPGLRKIKAEEIDGADPGNFYTLNGDFNAYGKVDDVNDLLTLGNITSEDIYGVQNTLWGGAKSKPGSFSNFNNDGYQGNHERFGVDNVNMCIDKTYVENGNTYDVESAEVFVTFVGEYAWNENSFGYYYYEKGTNPKVNDLKKIIILPNASAGDFAPFGTHNSYAKFDTKEAPASINTCYQLLYAEFGNDGEPTKVTKHFPPNTTIGFFLIVNGFGAYQGGLSEETVYANSSYPSVHTSRSEGKLKLSNTKYYSNKEFNSSSQKRYIALSLEGKKNTIVYGIEDASDWSCDDFLFTLHSTPALSLKPEDPNIIIPTVKPKEEPTSNLTNKTIDKTYAYEDIWPGGGDYDLSDVVVRHTREITYDNKNNSVKKVEDKFTMVDDGHTEYKNAFAIVYPEAHRGNLTLPTGVEEEQETGAIILVDAVRDKNGETYTITRTFTTAIGLSDIEIEDINPFIINQTTGPTLENDNRIEIHLPNHPVTKKGRPSTDTASPWFVSFDRRYPYALEIPTTTWVPCANGVKIGEGAYLDYNNWVESGGKEYTDWYKNK